jgi:hypothetical protein
MYSFIKEYFYFIVIFMVRQWLGASFSPRQPEFSAMSVYVRFVVDVVALGEVSSE